MIEYANCIEAIEISKKYRRQKNVIEALKPLSLHVKKSEIVGVVGESGSGKSTLLKLLSGLEAPSTGKVLVNGKSLNLHLRKNRRQICQTVQMIFQNPQASFNPNFTMKEAILDNMRRLRPMLSTAQCVNEMESLMAKVGLTSDLAIRYPNQLSGGQCQRFAMVRALVVKPKILLCDEMTSALDVLVQAQVVDYLLKLSREMAISIIFVTHDLALASNFCNRLMVMRDGMCLEQGPTHEVIFTPNSPYTKQLIALGGDTKPILERCEEGA